MNALAVVITSARGVFAGVRLEIHLGDRLTVGRSRFVDLSAATTAVARRLGRDKLEKSRDFRRMSRRHFEIVYEEAGRLVIVDHSKNGLHVAGKRVEGQCVLDPAALQDGGAAIAFGAGEELRLRAQQPVPTPR